MRCKGEKGSIFTWHIISAHHLDTVVDRKAHPGTRLRGLEAWLCRL